MKTKLLLFAFSLLMTSIRLSAQNQHKIHGVVKDDKDELLPGVTVSLLNAKDSSLYKAAITDVNGTYEIETGINDTCVLSYSSIGFQTKYTAIFILNNIDLSEAAIQLEPETKKLNDVVITTRKPTIDVRADKVVFNVEGSINATGSNALELLQKSPGVMVNNDESISLKGRNGVKIYIDGKMTQLDDKSLAAYLKSIGSNDIEAIEIITNPGSKYDASGNAGIINIRLKKNKKFGTNGNIALGYAQGLTPKANTGFSLNYRNQRINVFSNVSSYLDKHESKLGLYRVQNDTVYDQHTTLENHWKSVDVKAGVDYFANAKNTFGVIVTSNYSNGAFNSNGYTDIYGQSSEQYSKRLESSNNVPGNRTNADFNINYRYADTNETTIGFDADYGLFRGRSESYQPNHYYNPAHDLMYEIINGNNTPTNISIYTAKLDFEHKLWKGKLGYGAKYANVKTDNSFMFYDYPHKDPVVDLSLSNQFVYTENVNAAYVNYNSTFSKWSFQTGLRMEQTNSEGILTRADGQVQDDNYVKRNYLNLFPSLAVSYNLDKNNTVGFNYSRRIDRPDYQDLNPFENKLDQLTYEKGNAFLKPQYTNNLELSYTFKSMINANIGYAHVRDYAVTITDTINGNATFLQKQNIASQNIYSFNISSPLPIRKWWNGYVNFWYNYQVIEGAYNGISLSIKSPSFGGYIQQTFSLGKNYTAEISGWYSGKGLEATWTRKAVGAIDMGIQKRFWDEKASIKLSVSDILHTARFQAISNYGGTYLNINQSRESRIVRLNFSYRFGSNQIKAARQHKTALDSEGSRIK
ncbi:TonB-dependent receptor [Taibaiella lutea]|uniref:TonB-dependent receptor n=1 Tax=Taibaiella lutea TaxID=2608001 RepID=A0A5M6CJ78_9BACT|nr:outer membrane beta-barrel family protein [Taibaiella lutea]KAA5535087.1 TonB-dependent receptor [Taibaiella lutea]